MIRLKRAGNVLPVAGMDHQHKQFVLLHFIDDPVIAYPQPVVIGACQFAGLGWIGVLGQCSKGLDDPPLDLLGKFIALLFGLGGKLNPERSGSGHGPSTSLRTSLFHAPSPGNLFQGDSRFALLNAFLGFIGQIAIFADFATAVDIYTAFKGCGFEFRFPFIWEKYPGQPVNLSRPT